MSRKKKGRLKSKRRARPLSFADIHPRQHLRILHYQLAKAFPNLRERLEYMDKLYDKLGE